MTRNPTIIRDIIEVIDPQALAVYEPCATEAEHARQRQKYESALRNAAEIANLFGEIIRDEERLKALFSMTYGKALELPKSKYICKSCGQGANGEHKCPGLLGKIRT